MMMKYTTKKDIQLITYLRSNARENLTKISRMTTIPVSTLFDKLKDYERTLINKHTSLIDFKRLGFDIRLNILFKISKDQKDQFKSFLIGNKNINNIYKINNGYDYLVEVIFRNMNELEDFIDLAEEFGVEEKQELFILEDIKREGFLADHMNAGILFAGE